MGPQKSAFCPPQYNSAFPLLSKPTKFIFNPIANGNNQSTVVIAVNKTGLSLVRPDSMMVSFISEMLSTSF